MTASTQAQHQPYRELARRANGGVEVVLFWHQFTNELTVTVSDERSGAYFELPAHAHEALDVFNHPYAHAAFRGLSCADVAIASCSAGATDVRAVTYREEPTW
jgi:hypothetical protein